MVFTSLPIYLDPPNWNQQQTNHQPLGGGGGGGGGNGATPDHTAQLQPLAMTSAPRQELISMPAATAAGSIRPGSMADRARLAKIPQPDPALKCPRCDSSNTKFCYFNNYSLSQPRHFCKTCRRYWTRGGALRNVPVGGGCRRNKRSKSSASGGGGSKSASSAVDRQAGTSSSTSSTATGGGGGANPPNFPSHPQLPFLASLHPLAEFGMTNLGLNFTGMQPIDPADYQLGSGSNVGLEQWRIHQQIQQFPFLGGLDTSSAAAPAAGIYPFDGEGGGGGYNEHVMPKVTSSGLISQFASVKMEDAGSQRGLNLPRQYLGIPGNDQYWGGGGAGGWPMGGDLSGFNSSSSGNAL